MRIPPIVLTLATIVPLLPGRAAAQVIYTITDLGSFGGSSGGNGLNAAGQVTGASNYPDFPNGQPGPMHAFRTAPGGRVNDPGTDLGTLGGQDSSGLGINAAGQVAGFSQTIIGGATTVHAFRTTPTGRVSDPGTDLGVISGPSPGVSSGYGINSIGQVTGDSSTAAGGLAHAFRSTPNGQPLALADLGAFPTGSGSRGYGINDAGQVVGLADYAPGPGPGQFGPTHAFRTTAVGVLTDPGADLGTLGGTQSEGKAINSSGQVTGDSFTAFGAQHAFRSSPNGQPVSLTDLGTLGGTISHGYAINSFGVVVGDSTTPAGVNNVRAFIYDTQMHDLNTLIPPGSGWLLSSALDINDLGQITGVGGFNGQTHAFLLTPIGVPEPSALVLIGLAAGGWLWRRRLDRTWSPSQNPLRW
jgi:probable HAF family extracellular repeat protein